MVLIHYIDLIMTNTVHQWALFIFILLNLLLNLLRSSKETEVIISGGLQRHETSDERKCGERSGEEQQDENLGQADELGSSASYFQCDWLQFCLQWQTGREDGSEMISLTRGYFTELHLLLNNLSAHSLGCFHV